MLQGFVYRKVSLQQRMIFLHDCLQEIGIVAHILFVDHFTPHPGARDLLDSYSWNLHKVVMAAISINCPDIQPVILLDYAHGMIPRVMDPHGIVMIGLVLVAVNIGDECAVPQTFRTVLNIFYETDIQRIVIVEIG